jgi:hypothetical protein
VLTELHEQWTNNQWVNSLRYTYAYDANGRVLTELHEQWTNNQWVNSLRYTHTYDANGNMAMGQGEIWQGGIWVPLNVGFVVADSAGNFYSWAGYKVLLRYRFNTTDVAHSGSEIPTQYELTQNYPNPFNPSTTIQYALPQRSHVTLTVFNTLGQQVTQLVNGEFEPGNHEVKFDGSNLSSGVYFYRIQAGEFIQTRKLLLLR